MDIRETASVLGPSALLKGDLSFEGDARIQGTVEGTIYSAAELRVEQGGHVRGTIHATTISVDGRIEGDLIATERLELLAHAEVKGDIACRTLVVVQGAIFSGRVEVGPDANTLPRPERSTATKPAASRLTRPRSDQDWAPEIPAPVAPLTPVTTPASRLPEWATPVPVPAPHAPAAARPAWMSGLPSADSRPD